MHSYRRCLLKRAGSDERRKRSEQATHWKTRIGSLLLDLSNPRCMLLMANDELFALSAPNTPLASFHPSGIKYQ